MSEQNDILKLIGQLQFIRDYECKTEDEVKAMCEAIRIINDLPTAQPIIRCRNCVNRMLTSSQDWCCVNAFPIKPDDFCSYAVRREETNERTEI